MMYTLNVTLVALLITASCAAFAHQGDMNRDARVVAAAERCEGIYKIGNKPLKAKRMDNLADDIRRDWRKQPAMFNAAVNQHKKWASNDLGTLKKCNAFVWR
ncbi:hypothetical protein [Ferrimonas aestuarii]|uniref:Uncharacterized protein n=1 Tax=Ferrimonas aestuarii TaxID=2569539 RepID=A0A4U1BUF1_9GAMM|nr:hypothetical protein [Ferrimonas aestuarii]TKB57588.1 hypothetical protein FCL42_04760 [Ferrimonas aestuarii]